MNNAPCSACRRTIYTFNAPFKPKLSIKLQERLIAQILRPTMRRITGTTQNDLVQMAVIVKIHFVSKSHIILILLPTCFQSMKRILQKL